MMLCFKSERKKEEEEEEEEETSSPFLDNGSALLKELITTFNGRQQIPIRCYTAEGLITATDIFPDKVGETNFAYIYKGFTNNRQVLIRKSSNEESTYHTIHDIAITSQMSQLKNVLKLSGCCLEFRNPAMVYEYIKFETLHNLLHYNENLLPWRNRIKIAVGIANAVLYLHTSFQTPIIYRDLKPPNVLIDEHGVAKLIDFSLSISLPRGESKVEDIVMGTLGFMDPEYKSSGFLTQKSDVYSFGVILLVLVTGQRSLCHTRETAHIVDYVKDYMEKDQLSQVIDPKIVNDDYQFDQQQLRAILDLGMRCVHMRSEDRPEMIQVARELRQIEKSISC